jgi:hypothetical protein
MQGDLMPIEYQVDKDLNVVLAEWSGDITAHDVESHFRNLVNDPVAFNCAKDLADVRRATFRFKGQDLSDLINRIIVPALKGRKWKTAILVERPDQFGTARQYSSFADTYSIDSIFYDREAALAWLVD